MRPDITRASHPEEPSGHATELEKIEAIFHAALDCEPDKQDAFLDSVCGGDDSLRRKVGALLRSDQQASDFIEKPPTAVVVRLIAGEATAGSSLIGRTIGHYKITQHLGGGGMGEVYVALDTRSERKAVLKLLPARFTSDPDRIKRFQHEARVLVALNHPNILTTYEIGEEDSTYYIVSELVEGETLRQRLDRHRLELKEAIDVAIQVASALASTHEAGIVHRDIKPENIMLRRDGYVKVLDFGIAKLAEQELASKIDPEEAISRVATHVGSILGTVRYMSPEQARGEPVDHRTDIWSLGVVLYEMVTGRSPFHGDTPAELIKATLTLEPSPMTRPGVKLPHELEQIAARALRKDRQQRYTRVNEMLDALKNVQRKLEVATELAHAPLWLRWIRTPAGLLLALLVVALAISMPLFWSRSRSPGTESKPSIAVLPFENRSEDKADAYLADGIQDEVLTRLANIAGLKVISRTSTERYKTAPKNLRDIAKELGVTNILEGSVQRVGDQVHINVQLIKAKTDEHLWAQSYDQKFIDIFAAESEVARRVAETLSSKLTGEEKKRLENKPTNNPAAYDAYLRGLALATSANSLTLNRTLDFFAEAVRLDPTFATAWARLSITNSRLYFVDHLPSRRDAAKFALDKALELNADLGEVLLANGYYYYRVRNDFESAATAFREVLLRMPNNAEAISGLGWVARRQGKWSEALEQQNLGLQLDPENAYALGQLYGTYFALKDFTAAHATEERVLKIDDNPESHAGLARLYLAQGDIERAEIAIRGIAPTPERYYIFDIQARLALITHRYADAIRMLEQAVTHPLPSYGFRLGEYEYLLALSQELAGNLAAARENYEKARVELEKLRRTEPEDPDAAIYLGLVYAGLGDKASAIREAGDAVRLRPASADSFLGPGYEEGRARIEARLGQTDSAIAEVRRLLDVNYLGPEQIALTRAILRLDPIWDPLRSDANFQQLANDSVLPNTRINTNSESQQTESRPSIAVLPLQSLSEEKSNAYFADGIQDEILARLSKISDLKVISRTSTQKYKNKPSNLRDIAQQLGVSNILEGSVQKMTDQVRISVQLINALNDSHLWAETYDRKLLDTFQVESDIAEKIASTLEAKLTGKEKAAISARGTDNAQAYETYLRALALNNSQSDADNARMRDLLREAVGLDPNFAEAWAWLAVIESNRYFFPEESPAQKERARNAAETALRLAPDSSDAIGSMGLYYYYVEKNYDEALRWLDRARAIAPNVWKCISATSLVKRRQGKLDEAIALQERGAELDPLNVSIWMDLAWSYRGRRDFEHERAILDRALTISPNDANIVAQKAESYLAGGDLEKSWQMVRDLKFEPSDNGVAVVLDIVIARRDYDEAIRRITAMRESGKEPPLFQAVDRAVVGQLKLTEGDSVAAEPLLHQAEGELTRLRDRHEGGIIVLEQLMFVEACLGRPEEVERIGEQLRATRRDDKWTYPFGDLNFAIAYALMGDADRAVPLLDTVLHETCAEAATPAYLRFDPRFDRIRNDPRFKKLANSPP